MSKKGQPRIYRAAYSVAYIAGRWYPISLKFGERGRPMTIVQARAECKRRNG